MVGDEAGSSLEQTAGTSTAPFPSKFFGRTGSCLEPAFVILPDTSIWIEFLRGQKGVFPYLRLELENQNIVTVEWIFGELFQGAKNSEEMGILSGYWESLPHVEGKEIWLDAGKLANREKFYQKGVGLIDAAIIVAARLRCAKVWTLDKRLKGVLRPDELFEIA